MLISDFIRESNLIEGINRNVYDNEVKKFEEFLNLSVVTLDDLRTFQDFIAPNKPLREHVGMNVRVGNYIAPEGGSNVKQRLEIILRKIRSNAEHPWIMHCAYETLHPFLDGNGRTGRALWAWQMLRSKRDLFALSFLHNFYYQTLEHSIGRGLPNA